MIDFKLFGQEITHSGIILAYDITSKDPRRRTDIDKFGYVFSSAKDIEAEFIDRKGHGVVQISHQHLQVNRGRSGFYEVNKNKLFCNESPTKQSWYGLGVKNSKPSKENWSELDFLVLASDLIERIQLPLLDFKSAIPLSSRFNEILGRFKATA